MGVKFSVAGQGVEESSLWTYSLLGIYGPRRPLIAVLTFQPRTRSQRLQVPLLPGFLFLSPPPVYLRSVPVVLGHQPPITTTERKLLFGSLPPSEVWCGTWKRN